MVARGCRRRRGFDEMSHMWAGITNMEQDDYERRVAERQEREERIAARDGGG